MTPLNYPKGFIKTKLRVQVAELIQDMEPVSGHEIVQALNYPFRSAIWRVLHDMHKAKMLFIKDWTHPGRSNSAAPVWALRVNNSQVDAPRPPNKPKSEINRDWNRNHAAIRSIKQKMKRGTGLSVWAGLM